MLNLHSDAPLSIPASGHPRGPWDADPSRHRRRSLFFINLNELELESRAMVVLRRNGARHASEPVQTFSSYTGLVPGLSYH
ncbi:hypothetical protein GA0061105_1203 [Rhizobium aethiopicum]|uniref:Uncharacterized protein n=1 Tax=Rhizobium aethiopicum TaxID=1138170 RepID=A0A1C3YB02_9HYPH|nr:hypothetical protein GA0061105_1203 [Rhizobium aethiopicum]